MKLCPVCGKEVIGRSDKKFCSEKCGQYLRNKKHVAKTQGTPERLEQQRIQNKKRRATPRGKYIDHKHRAKQCGIPFLISFEDWWDLWKPYFNLEDGIKYCMCRTNDSGAYEVGNVRIDTSSANNFDRERIKRERRYESILR